MQLVYDIDSIENRSDQLIETLVGIIGPMLEQWFHPEIIGLERLPTGPALMVGNHNSGMLSPDSFILGVALFKRYGIDAIPYGLAHEVALIMPGLHQLLSMLGAVRASHDNAAKLFARNRKVLVYPGGDLDAFRSSHKRDQVVFGPRRGYIKLALQAKVPIVPVIAAGAHNTFYVITDGVEFAKTFPLARIMRLKVWPLTLSIPWGLTFGPVPTHIPLPTKILMEILEPIHFERVGIEAANDDSYVEECHTRVLNTMQMALQNLSDLREQKVKGL